MAIALPFTKEKLMCGILYHNENLVKSVLNLLQQKFGAIDYQGPNQDFTFSSYYNNEIGGKVKRVFISFTHLVDPSTLADIKIFTNSLEQSYAIEGNRPVNLDPGLMSLGRLILATTKNAGHRFALQNGIYGEVTLFYSRKTFNELPWTYPDFSSESVKQEMLTIRSLYHTQVKAGTAEGD